MIMIMYGSFLLKLSAEQSSLKIIYMKKVAEMSPLSRIFFIDMMKIMNVGLVKKKTLKNWTLVGKVLSLLKKHVVKRALIQMNVNFISYNLNLTIQRIYD